MPRKAGVDLAIALLTGADHGAVQRELARRRPNTDNQATRLPILPGVLLMFQPSLMETLLPSADAIEGW